MTSPQAYEELPPDDPFSIPQDPTKATARQRSVMAFELRKVGVPYDEISARLGYKSARSAEQAVIRICKNRVAERNPEQVVAMELERLDALQLVAWRRAKNGDLAAIDRILKIMEKRAEYLGLNAQQGQSQEVTHNTAIFVGGSTQDYIEQLRHLREQVQEGAHAIEQRSDGDRNGSADGAV